MRDYTKYDYQALVDRMTELLKNKEGWGDAYQSSMGQTLIQLMADVTDHLHYMLERRSLEGFLETARLRSSIIARASELGYRVRRIRGHEGYVRVKLVDSNGDEVSATGEVIIPTLTKITSEGKTFFVTEAAFIGTGESYVDVKVREGTITEKTFESPDNVLFQDFSDIDEDVFFVYNGQEEYLDVVSDDDVNSRSLSFLESDEAFYDIKYVVDGMRVVFGDDEFGKKPVGSIRVVYSSVDSGSEPIISIGKAFKLESDEIADFQYPAVTYKYIAYNVTSINGGGAEESLEDIKKNAVTYHKTNGRAVTNEDYTYWALRSGIGDVVDVRTFGEEELESLIYNANNVYITYATGTGVKLSVQEQKELREYINKIKTSQAHIVLNQAKNVYLKLDTEIKKSKSVAISNAQAYGIVYNFLEDYFKIRRGSIGGHFHLSDLVNAMYGITVDRNGTKQQVIDYVKISADAILPFQFPPKTGECFIEIDPSYTPVDGHEFVVSISNLVCRASVDGSDTIKEILLKMRDVVRSVTPFDAYVHVSGIALDAFGNPMPVEINPKVGYHLLIGVDTPYISETDIVAPAVIGSSIIGVVATSPALEVNHFYYSSPKGRRPMIPLRVGTTVNFTAPTDTDVKVYTRETATSAIGEEFVETILAGESYSVTITDKHVLIFEYVNDSSEDVIANIVYPEYDGVEFGLKVKAVDNFGTFTVNTTSGNLSPFVTVDYNISLPVPDFAKADNTKVSTLAGSIRICDTLGNILVVDDSKGNLIDPISGAITTGKIDYKTGVVTLPKSLPAVNPAGEYLIMFDQDKFDNLDVGSGEVIHLIKPKKTADSSEFSLSSLVIS